MSAPVLVYPPAVDALDSSAADLGVALTECVRDLERILPVSSPTPDLPWHGAAALVDRTIELITLARAQRTLIRRLLERGPA